MRLSKTKARGLVAVFLVGSVSLALAAAPSANRERKTPGAVKPTTKASAQESLDAVLNAENGSAVTVAPPVSDLAFLRRVSIDLIGRAPGVEEIESYLESPGETRRENVVERLLNDVRFSDRWSVFFADMLRIRTGASGGDQFLAYVHQALEERLPYDEMCRRLIAANGRPTSTPAAGFALGDNADPLALAGATAQVFLGVRIACAQCHDHPFDKWKRRQFHGLAAYFGKTRRIESPLTRRVYSTEADESVVLWPPEGMESNEPRRPLEPEFPFELASASGDPRYIARLRELREAEAREKERQLAQKDESSQVEDLLADADREIDIDGEKDAIASIEKDAKAEAAKLDVQSDLYRASASREELAKLITDPRNRFFARNLVNRVWSELLGRGFVAPVDDFSDTNPPSHPKTLDWLADEFVARGFDLRALVRLIVTSEAYQRDHLTGVDDDVRQASESAFAAAILRRMNAETLYDSIVQAGHLFSEKYRPGENQKIIRQLVRVPVEREGARDLAGIKQGAEAKGMKGAEIVSDASGYDLETAVEVDFGAVLAAAAEELKLEQMEAMKAEDPAMMSADEEMVRYLERYVETRVDDNPKFASAMRMASPAAPSHFLRIFGQPARDALGDHRDSSPSMRQALMMLNGKLTHEASRVGSLEPMHELLSGSKANPEEAVRLAYRQILTRDPSADELAEGLSLVAEAESPLEGMADLRWVMFNCHEFRFLP